MLKFDRVCFQYQQNKVLEELSFTLGHGEILALMAPSGFGKSTVLNLIAGLRMPTSGRIICNAQKIAYAFQEPRLFPWLTVEENIRAVLNGDGADSVIAEALEAVELTDAARLYPAQLSGGMKSRAALARALAFGGDLLLLDEPFSALGEEQRTALAKRLRETFRARGLSVILVTHQSTDAEILADRTILLTK